MKTIYLIRHGESRSQSGEDADEVNPVLSEKGEQQAEALAQEFVGMTVNKVYLSPLLRAWLTYRICNVQARVTTVTSLLVEDPLRNREDFYRELMDSPDPAIFPGDEDDAWFVEPRTRAKRLLSKILKDKASTIVCFGHWAIFNQVLQVFLGYEEDVVQRRAVMDNCHVSKLQIEPDGTRLMCYWNRPHLG